MMPPHHSSVLTASPWNGQRYCAHSSVTDVPNAPQVALHTINKALNAADRQA